MILLHSRFNTSRTKNCEEVFSHHKTQSVLFYERSILRRRAHSCEEELKSTGNIYFFHKEKNASICVVWRLIKALRASDLISATKSDHGIDL